MATNLEPLPERGPPFRAGDEVAFFSAVIASLDDPHHLRTDYAVIDEVDEESGTFQGHFMSDPRRFGQDMENIVRRSPAYDRWRSAVERAIAEGRDPDEDAEQI